MSTPGSVFRLLSREPLLSAVLLIAVGLRAGLGVGCGPCGRHGDGSGGIRPRHGHIPRSVADSGTPDRRHHDQQPVDTHTGARPLPDQDQCQRAERNSTCYWRSGSGAIGSADTELCQPTILRITIGAIILLLAIPIGLNIQRPLPGFSVVSPAFGFLGSMLVTGLGVGAPLVVLFLVNQRWPAHAIRPSISTVLPVARYLCHGPI